MKRLKNGIYATAMNAHIMKAYEEIEDEDLAETMLEDWLINGVPDGNELMDNINDFGEDRDYNQLLIEYFRICDEYKIVRQMFFEEVEEIKKNIVEMLDNPYYNMV